LSVKGHVPEKDGILACLLMAELVATEKKPLGRHPAQHRKADRRVSHRPHQRRHSPEKKRNCCRLGSGLLNIGPFKVQKFITTDGYKFLLPNSEWVAFRASGTEPLIRCYIEAGPPASSGNCGRPASICWRVKPLPAICMSMRNVAY